MKKKKQMQVNTDPPRIGRDAIVKTVEEHATEKHQPRKAVWYAAGRIRKEYLRFGIAEWGISQCEDEEETSLPLITTGDDFVYSGPYTVSCDHRCGHRGVDYEEEFEPRKGGWSLWFEGMIMPRRDYRGTSTHGSSESECFAKYDITSPERIFKRAIDGIRLANCVFVWIEDELCFGTLFELGLAYAWRKRIYLAHSPKIDRRGELWFALCSATYIMETENPEDAWRKAVQHEAEDYIEEQNKGAQWPDKKRQS